MLTTVLLCACLGLAPPVTISFPLFALTVGVNERGEQMLTVMTLSQVASYLKCHPGTIYRYLKARKVPAFKAGKQWRFTKESIDNWIHDLELATAQGQTGGRTLFRKGTGGSTKGCQPDPPAQNPPAASMAEMPARGQGRNGALFT